MVKIIVALVALCLCIFSTTAVFIVKMGNTIATEKALAARSAQNIMAAVHLQTPCAVMTEDAALLDTSAILRGTVIWLHWTENLLVNEKEFSF